MLAINSRIHESKNICHGFTDYAYFSFVHANRQKSYTKNQCACIHFIIYCITTRNCACSKSGDPTEYQLPFNEKNAEREYCQLPIVKLSTSDAQGVSENEIAGKLMDLHLAYFNSSQAPDWCRIDRYNIGKIYYDERTPYLPLQPKGDIMRVVHYSIKLIQVPSFWMSLAGTIDKQNWLHSIADVAIFRLADGYTMQFAYP